VHIKRASIAIVIVLCAWTAFAQQSAEEQAVWKLEHSYWDDVKALDLNSYLELWHPNFVGWPSVSAQPQRKDHITDWITAYTAKGLHLKSYTLEPDASQMTGNVIVVHYWLTPLWTDKNDSGEPYTLRITHTWIRTEKGWKIIGGMSAAETANRN
jgi:ketosteroid isomerase-like protein